MLSLPPSVLRAHNSEGSGIFDLFIQTEKAAVSTIKDYRAMFSSVLVLSTGDFVFVYSQGPGALL